MNIEFQQEGNSGELQYKGKRIKTLEDLQEVMNLSDEWQVDRHVVNVWETTVKDKKGNIQTRQNWQVKAFMKRLDMGGQDKQELIESMKAYAPNYEKREYPKREKGVLLEINPYDLHFNKLATQETSGEDYNTEIAKQRFETAIDELLSNLQGFEIERIVLPLGSDLLNIDSNANTTTKGTPQDTEKFYETAVRELRIFLIEQIDKLSNIAPVDIIMVRGNHDWETVFHLGDSLECWYNNNPDVSIDNSLIARKYYQYGECLIGYSHGDGEKMQDLALLMMRENQQLISNIRHMEFHIGHQHKSKSLRYLDGDEYTGIRVRMVGSLTGTDRRHDKKGYKSNPKLESFIWDKDKGLIANLNNNI